MKSFTTFEQDELFARPIPHGRTDGGTPDRDSGGLAIQGARDVYNLLWESEGSPNARRVAREFLREQLEQADRLPHDFPSEPQALDSWMEQKALETGERYAEYLERRKQGAPRLYFANKAHALSFLRQVAPTKLVDGAWLYGILPYWKDARFHDLIRIYLEELGDGVPDQNHALLYQRLLAENDCAPSGENPQGLSDAHYAQGAIQLAMAYDAEHFLPELIGYNLGYEQLPLHLLITAFELGELDIDPYYFTLHVTVDNAGTGHARRATRAVKTFAPKTGDFAEFWRRVRNGYQMNDLGLGTEAVIGGFDLERELLRMLERKRVFGQHVHSDYSVIDGRTVNEWLSAADQMKKFLESLEAKHWFTRNQDPKQSRFWRLLEGTKATMAGVFNGYEKQLLHDWIAGESSHDSAASAPPKRKVFRRYRDALAGEGRHQTSLVEDLDPDVIALRRELSGLSDAQRMQRLIESMNPSRHAGAAGLLATREFVAGMGTRIS